MSRARRFLFVTIGYPPFVGGAQTYVRQLAESLVGDGHQVTVYTTDAAEVERIWNAGKRFLPSGAGWVGGVLVRRIPLRHLRPSPLAYYLLRRLTVALGQVPGVPESLLWRLARFTPWMPELAASLALCDPAPDVVHGFAIPFEPLLEAAADYALGRHVPFVATPFLHTGPPDDRSVQRGYAMPHQVALLRRAAAVVALSEGERRFLLERGLDPARVVTIPAGIPRTVHDDSVFSARGREPMVSGTGPAPMILFLGAITYEKGAVHLLQAMHALWSEGVDVDLTLAGTMTDRVLRYIHTLPDADRRQIHTPGVVTEEEKARLLARCTALALPSRVDSFGLVLLEAWEHGRPVIGARAGGIPEIVDHEANGLLVPFGDVPALTAAVRRLLFDPRLAHALGGAGRSKLTKEYAWESIYPRLLALYDQILGGTADGSERA